MFKSLYDPYQMWKIPPLPLLVAFKEKALTCYTHRCTQIISRAAENISRVTVFVS